MSENFREKQNKLDKIVKTRIKGLGLDALFHQVDISKKDEDKTKPDKRIPSSEDAYLLEKLKRGLPAKKNSKLLATFLSVFCNLIKESIAPKTLTKVVLDIGTTSIKLVELKRPKDKTLLNKAVYLPIPHIVTTTQEKLEKFTIESISQIIDTKNIRKSFVSTLLPRSMAIVKFITLPTQEEGEIKKMLEFEAEHHLPFSLSEVEFDYDIIKRDANGTKLILAAIKKDEITRHLSLLEKLDIRPDTIEISALALYNSAVSSLRKEEIYVQVNIGAAFTDINIIKNGALSFSRGINWGSGELTLSLCKNLNVSFDDAEKIKKENGILLTKKNENPAKKSISDIAILWADYLINEIKRTVEFFQLKEGSASIDQAILSGGGCKLLNLNEYLREKLKVKVAIQKTSKNIEVIDSSDIYDKYPRELNLLLGLAWRSSESGQLELNLLPQKIKHSLELKKQKIRKLAGIGTMVFAISLTLILPVWVTGFRNRQIKNLDRKLQEIKPELAAVQDLKDKIQTIEDYISTKQSSMEILREISIIVTPDIIIDKFSFEKGMSVTLSGVAQSHTSAVNFSKTLAESRFFENAKLKYTRKKNTPGKEEVDFEIVCTLKK